MRLLTIKNKLATWFTISFLLLAVSSGFGQTRLSLDLNAGWQTVFADSLHSQVSGFSNPGFKDAGWKKVDVPHNWDQYEGYRRLRHGNKHGYAWYRKDFTPGPMAANKKYFLFFEGVGSYATIWLNGKLVGTHAGGRTSFTLDVSEAIQPGQNLLAVRADHPAFINDLPWICGGCSDDRGWSEGSQPLGIFRPVRLIVTNPIRIQPFGVHVWNQEKELSDRVHLNITTEIKNYDKTSRQVKLRHTLVDDKGMTLMAADTALTMMPGKTVTVAQQLPVLNKPHLWSPDDPYLYKVITAVLENNQKVDTMFTDYGIRWLTWPTANSSNKQFLLNGKPVFINGTCEYEHLMGKSHAFDSAQIRARVMQIKAAGFNSFRDAHQPHNLLYSKYWNQLGILNWTQFSAHAWYDDPEFKRNFKILLTDWVKERRNDPAVIMWGLQNESKIPEDFARECTQLIRKLDPTSSAQRPVTTCNGGEGTDWNVPQNWSGTYGGDPSKYGEELKRQLLVGEYGAWRTLDLHTGGGFDQDGIYSEDRMTQLMEMKVRLAESVKDSVAGHYHWLFTSHENPGRVQSGEAYREIDRVGPVNYKGLFTPWGEPMDAFYMYRANYVSGGASPMVYIVSHTWPDRWLKPGIQDSIVIYSNCDTVELFNGLQQQSLGKKGRGGIGTHFQWDNVPVNYNLLYAEGRVNGRVVARDTIILHHLPEAPSFGRLKSDKTGILKPSNGYKYLYRVNCGGRDYTDELGNKWLQDAKIQNGTWGSTSWTDQFGLPAFYASQRYTNDPVKGTKDWPLFQQFRYGMNELKYEFPVANGVYQVELFFIEPWYGTGGGLNCRDWRLFDVAINGRTVLKDFDIWKEAGHDQALKKTFQVTVNNGRLVVSFPRQAAGEAIIAAIAIASKANGLKPAPAPQPLLSELTASNKEALLSGGWLETGRTCFANNEATFSALPPVLYGANWFSVGNSSSSQHPFSASFKLNDDADVYLATQAFDSGLRWLSVFADARMTVQTDENGGTDYPLYKKRFKAGEQVTLHSLPVKGAKDTRYMVFATPVSAIEPAYDQKPVIRHEAEDATLTGAGIADEDFAGKKYITISDKANGSIKWKISPGVADRYALHFRYINRTGNPLKMQMQVIAADGSVMHTAELEFPETTLKWATVDSDTGSYINAGNYTIVLSAIGTAGLGLDYLEVQ